MTELEQLVVAYQQQYEAVRACEAGEPLYEDPDAHERWKESLAELREDLAKAHLELDIALFVDKIPDSLPA